MVLSPDAPVNKPAKKDVENQINILKEDHEKLLQLVETYQYEEKQAKNAYQDLKEKYVKLLDDNDRMDESLGRYKREYEELFAGKKYVEDKIKENTNQMIIYEKKMNETLQNSEKWEIENKYLKQELSQFKEVYNEMEYRKNSEIDLLMRDLGSMKIRENEFKLKISELENEFSDMKYENNKLKQDVYTLNLDCDHLTKLIEDSNFAVKSANEKEKHIDTIIKGHKKKTEEAILEKEKSQLRLQLYEKQIHKLTEDYSKLLAEKQAQYEQFIDSSKGKFENLIDSKDDEIAMLKSDNISLRIEKEKFMSEYKSIKGEYDKLFVNYREDNEKYIRKFEESEKSGFRIQSNLQEKVNHMTRKVEEIEYEKNFLEQELTIYKSNDKSKEQILERNNKNEENYEKDIYRLREKVDVLSREKEGFQKDLERKTVHHETTMKQVKEQFGLKVSILENAIKYQKDQFTATEDKAYAMMKKHENVRMNFTIRLVIR
jgi:chromosome segregation ATPase